MTLIYLATPYSHEDPEVMERRYECAVVAAAELMKQGHIVFAPIVHSHAIGKHIGMQAGGHANPANHEFWMKQDLPVLERCDELYILTLRGWEHSRGVKEEIECADRLRKPVHFVSMGNLGLDESKMLRVEALTSSVYLKWPDAPPAPAAPFPSAAEIFGEEESPAPATAKDTNPKDRIGGTKLPLSLVPPTAVAVASLAHLDGATRYGTWNWRAAGVRASVYLDALLRHVTKWQNGEETDPTSGVSHLGHALACLNILVDAQACGKLIDDRPPSMQIGDFLDKLTPLVADIKQRNAEHTPHHYTIADSEER